MHPNELLACQLAEASSRLVVFGIGNCTQR
jgi:hypothetical protein